ncbi:MAG: hypothetical protein ACRD1J_09510, partial [Terriglobia bacterium]
CTAATNSGLTNPTFAVRSTVIQLILETRMGQLAVVFRRGSARVKRRCAVSQRKRLSRVCRNPFAGHDDASQIQRISRCWAYHSRGNGIHCYGRTNNAVCWVYNYYGNESNPTNC